MANVLLIDDDEILRDTVAQFLELDGHRVTTADDGERGLEALRRDASLDLVLTDIYMPRMDGAHAIVELRKIKADLPIIAMSGGRRMLSSEFSLGTASIVGASERLSKPFTRMDLQGAVARALSRGGKK